MTGHERHDLMPASLPAQVGGFLPTRAFWRHAIETRSGLWAHYTGAMIYVAIAYALGPLALWQLLLLLAAVASLWLGLFERWMRGRSGG